MLTAPETNDGRYFMGDVIDIKTPNNKPRRLTAKQELFASELVNGVGLEDGLPLSQAEAYRRAYSCGSSSDSTIWREASKLCRNPLVTARVSELRGVKDGLELASGLSQRDWIISQLTSMASDEDIPPASRVRSLELLGKHTSLWTGQVSVVQPDADALKTQLSARLEELLTVNK